MLPIVTPIKRGIARRLGLRPPTAAFREAIAYLEERIATYARCQAIASCFH